MNIRKNIDYSDLFAALDAAMQSGLQQMEQYCELGRLVSNRPEKGAAVAAAAYLKMQYPETSGFSPRNLRRMRDFYRLYEGNPDMLELAMQLGWTQNVVILEAELNTEELRWYLQAVKQFGWSKAELQSAITSDAHQELTLDESEDLCYTDGENIGFESAEHGRMLLLWQILQKADGQQQKCIIQKDSPLLLEQVLRRGIFLLNKVLERLRNTYLVCGGFSNKTHLQLVTSNRLSKRPSCDLPEIPI